MGSLWSADNRGMVNLFIYDEKTLRWSIETAGFESVRLCALNQSEYADLRSLENQQRMPVGFLDLESVTLEATKAPAQLGSRAT